MSTLSTESERRRNSLFALLLFSLPVSCLLLFINLREGPVSLVLLSLALFLGSLGALALMRRGVSQEILALAYLSILFANIGVLIARPDIHPGTTSWITALPVLPYLLLRVELALPVAALYLGMCLVAFLLGAEFASYRLEGLLIIHVSIPTLGFVVASHFYFRSREKADREMLELLNTDPLTRLWNRAKLLSEFAKERERARREGTPLSIILIDLDRFKMINDQYGHEAGDSALIFFAELLKGRLREIDLPCRIGGEEFAILLPSTAKAGAATVAGELRASLEASRFHCKGEAIGMTLSAGVAEYGQDGRDWPDLYRAADLRLYACKTQGRNCVVSQSGQRRGLQTYGKAKGSRLKPA